MDKFKRLEGFCRTRELAVKSESIEDTFKDIAIYSVLALILYRKEEDDATQELTEVERGKDAENDEDEYCLNYRF